MRAVGQDACTQSREAAAPDVDPAASSALHVQPGPFPDHLSILEPLCSPDIRRAAQIAQLVVDIAGADDVASDLA